MPDIDALAAEIIENEKLRDRIDALQDERSALVVDVALAQKRIDALEAALRDIGDVPRIDSDEGAYEMKRIAREALEGVPDAE
jgi:ACT domain-containing protein